MKQPTLVVIAGPTAVGKTAVAIQLARHFNTEIISADSRQVYTKMNIGTAKPTEEELKAAKHHLIDILEPTQLYSAGDFERDALEKLKEIFQRKSIAIMAGGSGFYVRAVCEGFDDLPEADEAIRDQLNQRLEKEGITLLQEQLKVVDPESYDSIDIQNPQRVIRALEVSLSSGMPFSSFKQKRKVTRPFRIIKIALEIEREALYERINKRVDTMIDAGLLEEVRSLMPYRNENALKTVGYREIFPYLDGKTSLEEAVKELKQSTRRYAKRQMTWLRREEELTWFKPTEIDKIVTYIENQIMPDC